jgi:hypothetical protein
LKNKKAINKKDKKVFDCENNRFDILSLTNNLNTSTITTKALDKIKRFIISLLCFFILTKVKDFCLD